MKRIPNLLYSSSLIALGILLYVSMPETVTPISVVYMLNVHLLLFLGIREIIGQRKKKAVIQEYQIIIKEGGKTVEKYDLKKAMKLSCQYNRLTIYYEGFARHLVFKEFTTSSQRTLRSIVQCKLIN